MGTFDALAVGETFATPGRRLDEEAASTLVRLGGYTHPLFTDPEFAARGPFGRAPVPGEALLLLMGGLVEQTERFDDTTLALLGFDEVRFLAPGFPGDTVRVDVEVAAKEQRSEGRRGVMTMLWRCANDRGQILVEATARMLFRLEGA